ncbi:hypothetical protein ACVWZZ_000144 [Bradyrhizobium sp. LM6.10]
MTKTLGWEFPVDEADQWEGFNNPGIEHFRGNPFGSLAREIIQNSLDAPSGSPVSVAFELKQIATDELPGIEQLRDGVQRCAKAETNDSKKAKDFFATAQKLLKAKHINVLAIRESKTTGIRGPCKNGTPYFAFMKATGISKKEMHDDDTGLGSYGIGKFAPFAVSQLRTVFVSTVYKEGNGYHQLTQGKALLTSHVDANGKTHQGTGYWGVRQNCMPVEGCSSDVPVWLRRSPKQADLAKRLGTTFYVLGFSDVQHWEKILIASVLENFFGAIWRGKLIVTVGKELITKETILELFEKSDWENYLRGMKGEPEAFQNARQFLRTLVGTEEIFVEAQENRELGLCEVRIAVGEGMPKRVAVLRNGMFITDQMEHLKRFGDYKEFCGVVECQNKKGNTLLRDMEPPKHDDFEPERLPPDEQAKGQRALSELARWVRDMLKRHARDPVADVSDVRELADYFADDSPDDQSSEKGEEVNPIGAIQIRAQPLKRKAIVIREEDVGNEGGSGQTGSKGGGGQGGGKATGNGNGGKVAGSPQVMDLNNVRSVPLSEKRRRVAFTSSFSGKVEVTLYEAGADTDRRLNVLKCSLGKVKKGAVNLPVKKGERVSFDIDLEGSFLGAMKVTGHEI